MVTELDNNPDQVKSSAFKRPNLGRELDAEKLVFLILKRWPLILLSTLLGFLASNLYLRYATPMFSAELALLIKDTRNSSGSTEATVFQDLGILNSGRNLDNELAILKTTSLMENVVQSLNLQYTYQSQGRLKSKDLYRQSPISVLSWEPNDEENQKPVEFIVTPKGQNKFEINLNNKTYSAQFGQAMKFNQGKLTLGKLNLNGEENPYEDEVITIMIRPLSNAANLYSKNLTVNVDNKTRSTVLSLVCQDPNPKRANDILTKLVEVYNESEIIDKNRIYENTVRFIDERMEKLGGELREVEGDVANFRSRTGAIDISGEGTILLNASSESNREIGNLDAQIEIIKAIRNQLSIEGSKFNFVPSSALLTTVSLNSLLGTFNQLLLERERLLSINGSKHPEVILNEKQLDNIRSNILEELGAVERDLNVQKRTLSSRDNSLSQRLRTLPSEERQLLEIQRQQAIKQQLYLYLLQKREESALSLSVTVANNRVIEPAIFKGQISPKTKQIQLLSLSLGFFIPIGFILLGQALNKKVMTEDHIIENTHTPLLGTIPFTEEVGHVAVSEKNRSAAAEMFRLTRANLQFIGEGVHNRVLGISSSISGEGKSFITLNLGLTIAMGNKKVIIIEMDMRKPKLAKYLGHQKESGKGLTRFLTEDDCIKKEIIYESKQNPNLYYIPCGPIPPNPSELLLSQKLVNLINELRSEYDYVLIDTPPIGLVSDALLINKLLDATIFIVRQGVTDQRQLRVAEDINVNNKMPRVYILFNGVRHGRGGYGYGGYYGYGYGYSYGYGYGYGYYSDDKKASWWKKLLFIK